MSACIDMTRVIRSFALHGEVCCLFRWSYLRFRRHRMKIVAQATEDTTARTPISLVPGVILKGVKVFPLTWSFFASYIKTNNAERSQVAFMILFPPFWSQSASLVTVILWRCRRMSSVVRSYSSPRFCCCHWITESWHRSTRRTIIQLTSLLLLPSHYRI